MINTEATEILDCGSELIAIRGYDAADEIVNISLENIQARLDVYDVDINIATESIKESLKKIAVRAYKFIVKMFKAVLKFFDKVFSEPDFKETRAYKQYANDVNKAKKRYNISGLIVGEVYKKPKKPELLSVSLEKDIVSQLKDSKGPDDIKQILAMHINGICMANGDILIKLNKLVDLVDKATNEVVIYLQNLSHATLSIVDDDLEQKVMAKIDYYAQLVELGLEASRANALFGKDTDGPGINSIRDGAGVINVNVITDVKSTSKVRNVLLNYDEYDRLYDYPVIDYVTFSEETELAKTKVVYSPEITQALINNVIDVGDAASLKAKLDILNVIAGKAITKSMDHVTGSGSDNDQHYGYNVIYDLLTIINNRMTKLTTSTLKMVSAGMREIKGNNEYINDLIITYMNKDRTVLKGHDTKK